MADDDEDMTNGELDTDIEQGTDSGGTAGQDTGGGDENPELSTEQPDGRADDGEPQPPAAPERAGQSRASARIQRLSEEAKTARAETERVRQELENFRRQQWSSQQQVTEQQERERFALMTDSEKADYRITKVETQFRTEAHRANVQMQLMADKIAYDAKAAVHPVYAKYKDEVERLHQQLLAQGKPVEREIIFENLMGKRAIEMAVNGGKQRKQAERRVANQQVNASSGKGDTASQRGKAGDTAEKRLQGVFI